MTAHYALPVLFVLLIWRRVHRDRVKWRKHQRLESRLLKQAAERFSEGKR